MNSTAPETINALIVDDEIDICYLLSRFLKKINLSTSFVTSLNEAEKTIEIKKPSLLFIDNQLSDGLGVDLISKIKKNHPVTKIVMITAHDTEYDEEKALSSGADAFIGKPFTRETIYNTLNAWFKIA